MEIRVKKLDQMKWDAIENYKIIRIKLLKYYYLNRINCKIDELMWVFWKDSSVK